MYVVLGVVGFLCWAGCVRLGLSGYRCVELGVLG